ncbi:50S ribosomal protein L19 [Candidatus Saccharibacteria bacterium RIFCSPHIGHO2_02_FULL_47_12]|nr:MAG: 50S ribosomal protein L19 [Candidatus Saccharibacteria bacterium RIFCSPHIGHO2_02_FULL_47_12]
MQSVISKVNDKYKKKQVVDVMPGDTVRVHQKIREGKKERVQVFEGMVIRVNRKKSHTATVAVRRIASGVGVEKTYLLHSPLVLKVEVVKRSKVRRNYLTYMRDRRGKSARLTGVEFDRDAVNTIHDEQAEAEEEKLKEETAKTAEAEAAKKEEVAAKEEAKAESAIAAHKAVEKPEESEKPEK